MIELSTLQAVREIVTIVGVIAGLSYYIMTVRNQNKARQAQLFMQLYQQYTDRDWLRQQQEINFIFEYDSFEEFMEKYGPYTNMEGFITWMSRANFYDGLGMLVKRGLIEAAMVDDMISGPIIFFWEKRVEPIVKEFNEYWNNPAAFEWVEYLYHQIKPIRDRQHPELKT